MQVTSGAVRAFYLFDVADTIDLAAMRTVEGQGVTPALSTLHPRPHASTAYLQFPNPPLVSRLPDAQFDELTCTVRAKFFDYGVVSLRFSFNAAGTWDELARLSAGIRRDQRIAAYAATTVAHVCDDLGAVLDDRHPPLVEDYYIVEVEKLEPAIDAETLLRDHAADLAGLLLAESSPLSGSEIEESLRTRFSYFNDDLTIVQWDTAFVYDRRESSEAIGDILEFANSQLLELRTYDARLDRELDDIYALPPHARAPSFLGRRESDRAAVLRYLIVDVLELTDRSSNALKVVGDAYYARIYRAAAVRLGLADWQRQIDSKLASVGDMYRFFVDQARSRRDDFLEQIVIALIAIEVIIGILTLVRH
jgi:hypothetical protein